MWWIVTSSWRVVWILEWESNSTKFQQFWKEITSKHTTNKKSGYGKWCGFAIKKVVTTVSSFTVLIIGKFKCMKTQSLEKRRVCDQDFKRVFNFWLLFRKKNEKTKETETYLLLLTDSK